MNITRLTLAPLVVLALQGCSQENPAPLSVDRANLVATIESLPVLRAAMGDDQSRANLLATQQMLFDQLAALGLDPRFEPLEFKNNTSSPQSEDQPYCNVIVDLPGTDLAHEVLVIGAHLDAVPHSPGANDNGTGVAALLEIARILAQKQSRRTIRLCLFNLEEVGLVGSIVHVQQMKLAQVERAQSAQPADPAAPPAQRIVGMISLDMLGYFTDEPDSQTSPIKPIPGVFEPPTVGDFISIVGLSGHRAFNQQLADEMAKASPGLKIELVDFSPVPFPDLMRSDHAPFLLAGIPAVMLTDTANFRNPNYHTRNDTLETIDLERFEAVVVALVGAIRTIANPPE